ncbi:MAG: hypothetical protein IKP96_05680 [Elusimicrobiaceae bacterium]|nr:hypothetical protein [Elusimicrobiaceae bacterium]
MENENLDLDVKPTGNKDLWLFLIIVDVILLCVFGFYLYKHFSVSLFQPSAIEMTEEQTEEVLPVLVEEPVAQPKPQPSAPESPVPAPEKPVAVAVEKPMVVAVESPVDQSVEPGEEKPVVAVEKKLSVLVEANSKSKYRRVTFRWYGEGKKVQIVSGFTMSKPQSLKKKNGYWETTLSILPGTYKFLYIIDGVNTRDPYSPEQDGRSVVVIE